MKIHRNNSGSLGVRILMLVVLVILVASLVIYKHNENSSSCKTVDGVEFCLSISETRGISGGEIILYSTITNKTGEIIKETFPCTNNEPTIYINDVMEDSGICLTAISEVGILPGESIDYIDKHSASGLEEGENTIRAVWAGYESNTLIVTN